MTKSEAEELYGFHAWGQGYFRVGPGGRLRVHPTRQDDVWVDLFETVEDLRRRKAPTPLVLRFPQIIGTQVRRLHKAFAKAISEYGYSGRYRGVFPIKVNQIRPFISELVEAGRPWGYGLEAGTKPELAVALSSGLPPGSLVICNGYKDTPYVELALAGLQLGYRVILILEQLHELDLVLSVAKRLGVVPLLGVRLKVHARGTGKWSKSGGDASKFGLTTGEILEAVRTLEAAGLTESLKLLHFHIGSQITSVRRIKQGVREGARFYTALRSKGLEIEYLDVGGGLGVDYDGSRTSTDSSVNYTLQEYANDVVNSVQEVCEEAGVPEPNLVSESGRAVSAYHSVVVFSAQRNQTLGREVPVPEVRDDFDRCVTALVATRQEITAKNYIECFHDALQYREEMHQLFSLGRISLEERAVAEDAAAQTLRDVVYFARMSGRRVPEEIEQLEQDLAKKYVCNFSIFQSLPDLWAIGQLFPIAPIHRLDEQPSVWATIADITCDSDGKIDRFTGVRQDRAAIRLHPLGKGPYHLAAFLAGAYQDVMGDFHNMLGETKEARVVVTGPGEAVAERQRVKVEGSGEVLEVFGYRRKAMREQFHASLDAAGAVTPERRAQVTRALERVLGSSPYLA